MRLWVVKVSSTACYEPSHIERERSYLQSLASPGTAVELVCPENGAVGDLYARSRAAGGPTGLDFTFLEPFIVRKLKEGEERGFDAAVVHCNSDPGVEAARHIVDIPVIGPGRAACHVAAMLAHRIGVVVPTQAEIPDLLRLFREYEIERLVTAIVPLNITIDEARRRPAVIRRRFCDLGRELMARGAEMILSSCAVFIPVYLSPEEAARDLGVPVLDSIGIAVGIAEMCVRLRIRHSRVSYPRPVMLGTADLGMFSTEGTNR